MFTSKQELTNSKQIFTALRQTQGMTETWGEGGLFVFFFNLMARQRWRKQRCEYPELTPEIISG